MDLIKLLVIAALLAIVFSLGSAHATEFRLMLPAKDFEEFRPKFDAIVDSYKGQ